MIALSRIVALFHPWVADSRGTACGTSNGALPGLYDGLCSNGTVNITALSDVLIVIGNVVRILIALSGGLATILIIYGAIYYVISTGDPSRIRQAKEILTQAVTGLLVILLSYAVVTFLVTQFA